MFPLFAQISRLLSEAFAPAPEQDLPHTLMEQAGARSGHDGRQARELRQAACAYLRVVR